MNYETQQHTSTPTDIQLDKELYEQLMEKGNHELQRKSYQNALLSFEQALVLFLEDSTALAAFLNVSQLTFK